MSRGRERAVGPEKLDVDGVLTAARRLREWAADYVIDDETIDTAKRAGRL